MSDTALGELVDRLGKARQELLAVLDRMRPAHLHARAGPEEWEVRQIVQHMTYAERRYLANVEAIRAALSLSQAHDLAPLLDEWRLAREGLLQALAQVAPAQLDQRIPGNDRTIREWAEMAIAHDRAHAQQLKQLLDQQDKGPAS
jgi:uncharacterized damage-inducible protein DinB